MIEPTRIVVEDVTCLACGCLCDDIVTSVENGQIIDTARACAVGRRWFLGDRSETEAPEAILHGQPCLRDEALNRASEILQSAKAPLVTGLTGATVEAVAEAVALADTIGAVIDPWETAESLNFWQAYRRVGQVSAMLGEVRDRADLLVFWGEDPLTTHPRHAERYSIDAVGRFVPEERAGRFVMVVDAERTATAAIADAFLPIARERWHEALRWLRARLRGVPDLTPWEGLDEWAERLRQARYGSWFFGPSLGQAAGFAGIEETLRLVRDLNEHTRFVALTLGSPGNAAGAAAVLSWQTGFPLCVDLSLGSPESLDQTSSAAGRIAREEVDACLVVGDPCLMRVDLFPRFHPMIAVGPGVTRSATSADVAIATARAGIRAGGTVVRVDGAWLPLRASLESTLPTDSAVLQELRRRFFPRITHTRVGF